MPLGIRPYKAFVTNKLLDANGAWVVTVEVRDSAATPTVRLTTTVNVSPAEELMAQLQFALLKAYAQDLGGAGPFLDTVINNSIPLVQL